MPYYPDATLADGTPIADMLEELASWRKDYQRLKEDIRRIESICDAPHWESARRWKIRDIAHASRQPEQVRATIATRQIKE
jgi:hypothetical protein